MAARTTIALQQKKTTDAKPVSVSVLDTKENWVENFLGEESVFDLLDEKEEKDKSSSFEEVSRNFESKITHAGLIHFLHLAWAQERSIELRPDMIWHAVVSEFAAFVLKNSDKFRFLFTERQAKKNVEIVSRNPVIDVNQLSEAIRNVISNPQFFSDVCDVNFQSAPKEANYCTRMAFACMATPYFNYMSSLCGIPSIELVGSVEEWKNLRTAVAKLGKYQPEKASTWELERFTDYFFNVDNTLEQIVNFSSDPTSKKAVEFFSDIFHYGKNVKCGSGHPSKCVSGWARFFYMNGKESDLSSFPGHVNFVPYTHEEQAMVQVSALSHSNVLKTNALSPQYGIITYKINDEKKANKLINPKIKDQHGREYRPLSNKQLLEITLKGRYYEPATLHYGELTDEKGVQCDRCRNLQLKTCIGYNDKDLCISCVEEMKKEYKELEDYTYSTDVSDLVLTDSKGVKYLAPTMERKIRILTPLGRGLEHVTCVCTLCRKYDIPDFYQISEERLCTECFIKLVISSENLEAFKNSTIPNRHEKERTFKILSHMAELFKKKIEENSAESK